MEKTIQWLRYTAHCMRFLALPSERMKRQHSIWAMNRAGAAIAKRHRYVGYENTLKKDDIAPKSHSNTSVI